MIKNDPWGAKKFKSVEEALQHAVDLNRDLRSTLHVTQMVVAMLVMYLKKTGVVDGDALRKTLTEASKTAMDQANGTSAVRAKMEDAIKLIGGEAPETTLFQVIPGGKAD